VPSSVFYRCEEFFDVHEQSIEYVSKCRYFRLEERLVVFATVSFSVFFDSYFIEHLDQ
jgi:hypothetical protein